MEERTIQRAVVTGATGMIGIHLVKELLKHKVTVYAIVRPDSKKRKNLSEFSDDPNLHIIECELKNIERLERSLFDDQKIDAWFQFAWDGVYGDSRNDRVRQMMNADYSVKAALKAKELGADVFLFSGSQAQYGNVSGVIGMDTPVNPETEYGKGKLYAEEELQGICQALSMDFVSARILSVYGPYDNDYTMVMSAVLTFLKGEKMSFTKGEQIWDYLYAGDCGRAFYHMALRGKNGRRYPLGSGRTDTLKGFIEKIRDAVDPALPLGIGELPYREHQVMHLEADISTLTEDTGFVPETDFTEGIKKTVSFVKERNSL